MRGLGLQIHKICCKFPQDYKSSGAGNMIRDFDDKITKYVVAVDKTQGEINYLKLGNY